MSCDSRRAGTISRCGRLAILALMALPCSVFAESVCYPIRGGETATQLARRITGASRNTYQPWFQIMDGSSRFVPKSQYDRIRRGWRACIVKETVQPTTSVQVQPIAQRVGEIRSALELRSDESHHTTELVQLRELVERSGNLPGKRGRRAVQQLHELRVVRQKIGLQRDGRQRRRVAGRSSKHPELAHPNRKGWQRKRCRRQRRGLL